MWQSLETSQTKDRPRPILGRLTVCPTAASNYEEWSNNDGHEASTQQEERSMPQLPLVPGQGGSKTKVNRSQSFSDTGAGAGLSMNMLLPPDPRRYSLASTGSGVSSTSSLSDIWAGAGPGGGASVWGGDHNDVTLGLYSGAGPGDLLRRRGSDSDCFSARTLRDTELGAWHREAARRRSSGYVSDASPAPAPVPGPAPSPGMEHVPQWLKHLRLHKYTECIMRLTYQDLVSLTDEQLQGMSVTKGARRKFLLSIQKLGERPQALAEMGARLEAENCDMKEILGDLETIVRSPILIEDTFVPDQPGPRCNNDSAADSGAEVSEDEDDQGKRMKVKVDEEASATPSVVPGQQLVEMIMTTLKKTASVILLSQHMDSKLVSLLTQVLDICLGRTCFHFSQKQLLSSWKHKVLALWGPSQHSSGSQRESQKVKFSFSPQSFKAPFKTPQFPGSGAAHAQWSRRAKSPETRDQLQLRGDQLQLRVPVVPWQPPHLYSHRKSAPNIHHFASTSLGPAAYKKRHSFQEGDHLQDQMSPGAVHGHGESLRSEKFWSTRDNLVLSPQYDWSHVAASTKIVVTCEDEPSHRPGEEEEEMEDNLENLCIAVTEQALN